MRFATTWTINAERRIEISTIWCFFYRRWENWTRLFKRWLVTKFRNTLNIRRSSVEFIWTTTIRCESNFHRNEKKESFFSVFRIFNGTTRFSKVRQSITNENSKSEKENRFLLNVWLFVFFLLVLGFSVVVINVLVRVVFLFSSFFLSWKSSIKQRINAVRNIFSTKTNRLSADNTNNKLDRSARLNCKVTELSETNSRFRLNWSRWKLSKTFDRKSGL